MVKVDTQSIPSEDRIRYKRALQISTTRKGSDYVRTRFPWRMPQMQEGGAGVSPAQRVNRAKFLYVRDKYKTLSAAEKARWAAANPEWHSYLFGYNFFMLEGFLGGGPTEYPQMIKSIQILKASVPTTGGHTFNLSPEIVGTKAVVLIQGSARKVPRVLRGSGSIATGGTVLNIGATVDPGKCTAKLFGSSYKELTQYSAYIVLPYVSAISSTQITIAWSITPQSAGIVGWEITEHLEGAVYPVLVSISNTQVVVDWAEEPDGAADVSITVVEYI